MDPKLSLRLLLLLSCIFGSLALDCIRENSCKCIMSDDSGTINLAGIHQNPDGSAKWSIYAPDYWYYDYNPCRGFTKMDFTDLAAVQHDGYGYSTYDLGVQSSAYFNYTDGSGLVIHYTAADGQRMSRVNLICARGLPGHFLYFVGELNVAEYDFILEGPCACPGGCNDQGIIKVEPAASEDDLITKWKTVSWDLVSLIFHDLIILFILVVVLFVMTTFLGYSCTCLSKPAAGFNNANFSSA